MKKQENPKENSCAFLLKKPRMNFLGEYWNYGQTYAVAIFGNIAMFVVTGLFAKAWGEATFLEYARVSRYLGAAVMVASFSLGFSVMGKAHTHSLKGKIFPAAIWGGIICALAIWAIVIVYTGDWAPICLWVVSQACFHVYVSAVRYEDYSRANRETVLFRGFMVLGVGVFTPLCLGQPKDYFWAYGLCALTVMFWRARKAQYSLSPMQVRGSVLKDLYFYSATRAVDNFIRIAFPVSVVWLAQVKLGSRDAGLLAVAFILLKALESSLQPVVMHLHAVRTKIKVRLKLSQVAQVFLAGVCVVGAGQAVLAIAGESFVELWLSSEYLEVLPLVKNVLLAVPCVFVIQYLRGHMESLTNHSPFLMVNLASFLLMAGFIYGVGDSRDLFVSIFLLAFMVRAMATTIVAMRLSTAPSKQ